MKRRQSESEGKSYSWCPICKHWVPSKYFIAEYDRVDDVVTRMCFNCAHEMGDTELPTFEHKEFRYDPQYGLVKCPFCGVKSEKMYEYNPRATKKDPQHGMWHCGHCGRDFKLFR